MSKINTKEIRPRQVIEPKTAENIKYELILRQLVHSLNLYGFMTLGN